MYFFVNGSPKTHAYRDEGGEYDMITLSSQLKLNKGDTVWPQFTGYFESAGYAQLAFFEGHLIRQLN